MAYMTVIKLKKIKKSFGEKMILSDVSLDIKENARIGLIGYNGTGKTTLANIIAGKLQADEGAIEFFQPLKIGYLLQTVEYEFIDFQKGSIAVENNDYFTATSQLGLNKVQNWTDERYRHLSGGEKLKLILAQIWASKPDILLLDEPTNHLDIQGIHWLIEELNQFNGPVIIISHDRYFLDEVAKTILELEDGCLQEYGGNYSYYRQEKNNRKNIQLQQYFEQEKYKQNIEKQIDQLNKWSDKAHRSSTKQEGFKEYHRVKAKKLDRQVKSKMKRLERELDKNRISKPKDEPLIAFPFQNKEKKGKRVLEAKKIEKTFGEDLLFNNSHFYIKHGEKVGVIGPNGCGKTTLIKLILGDESLSSGELWIAQSLKIAYLSQDILDLNEDLTVLESFGPLNRDQIYSARTFLANMGLPREISEKRIATLSLGERIRVKLIDLLLKEYDILILDEPTNHLDLPSREQLERTMKEYSGTLITVSHDYYFVERICDKLLVFENKQISRSEKNLSNYLYEKKIHYHNKNGNCEQEDILIIENRISQVLGELSLLSPTDSKYQQLDAKFKELIQLKKSIN